MEPSKAVVPLSERPEYLTTQDICEVFCVCPTEARRLIKNLPYIRVGKLLRVHKYHVMKAVRQQGGLEPAPRDAA